MTNESGICTAHIRSAMTNDHHGPGLAPNIALQYHAETSGQIAPCSSRIISHTATASSPWPARKQLIAASDAFFLTGIGVMQ